MTRKKYSAEFKMKIIDLIKVKGNRVSQISEKYLIEISIIRRWIKEYESSKNKNEKLFPGNGNVKDIKNKIKKKNEKRLIVEKKIIKDSKKFLKTKPTLSEYFEFIYKNSEKYSIIQMAEIFKINRSSYYKWLKKHKNLII